MDCLFIVLYLRCRFDYLATHWYSKTQNATETISSLREYSERYGGLRIWFTEFAVRQVGPGPGPGAGAGCRVVLQKVPSEFYPKVCNHGEGPY